MQVTIEVRDDFLHDAQREMDPENGSNDGEHDLLYELVDAIRADAPEWHFWLPDDDRSAGWTNHCYVLQFVCTGRGHTPEQAWADAKATGQIPDGFHLPNTVKAIRGDAEHDVEVAR